MSDVWGTDVRVLRQVVDLYERDGKTVYTRDVVEQLHDIDEHAVRQSVRRLADHAYIDTTSDFSEMHGTIDRVNERGLRTARFWPDDAEHLAERIMAALTEAAEQETEPETRGRLRRAASSVGEVGRDVFAEVIASVITKSAGLG